MNDISGKQDLASTSSWDAVTQVTPLAHTHHHDNLSVLVPTPIKMSPAVGLDPAMAHPPSVPQMPQIPHVSIISIVVD